MGIVVIGSTFMDIKGYPLSSYIPGGRNVGRVEQVHGGVCRNVVEDIANVELRPAFVSLVDDTGMGDDVLRKLNSHKVDTRYVRRVPDSMGTWLVIFGNDGDVIGSISKRPDLSAIGEILAEKGDEIFSAADSVVLEIDIDQRIAKEIFRLAGKTTRVKHVSSDEYKQMNPNSADRPKFSVLENYMFKLTGGYQFADWHDAISRYISEL